MNETDNKNKDNFLSTMHVKDNKLQNYKGQFYNNKDEADSHNHEYGGHFKIKDLFKGARHTMVLYYEQPLQTPQGYLNKADSNFIFA